jgi:hypothetical protein
MKSLNDIDPLPRISATRRKAPELTPAQQQEQDEWTSLVRLVHDQQARIRELEAENDRLQSSSKLATMLLYRFPIVLGAV